MYIEGDYAESRLAGTLVRHNDVPVYVRGVNSSLVCFVRDVLQGNEYEVSIDDLNLKSPPLGFVNDGHSCFYISRRPMRRDWRQGVRTNTVVNQTVKDMQVSKRTIALCMKGKYPKKSVALSKLRTGVREIAISREFSLSMLGKKVMVNYKWYGTVGNLTPKGVSLQPKWKYLLNRFKEAV